MESRRETGLKHICAQHVITVTGRTVTWAKGFHFPRPPGIKRNSIFEAHTCLAPTRPQRLLLFPLLFIYFFFRFFPYSSHSLSGESSHPHRKSKSRGGFEFDSIGAVLTLLFLCLKGTPSHFLKVDGQSPSTVRVQGAWVGGRFLIDPNSGLIWDIFTFKFLFFQVIIWFNNIVVLSALFASSL